MEEKRTEKVVRWLGTGLFWGVWLFGLYSTVIAAGWNLAAESAYEEVAGWTGGGK